VLARLLTPALERARERDIWLPVRPLTRRRWPNGAVTHEELRPLKMLASRMACTYMNPGRYRSGEPLVQGMRVALSAEVDRTHEELVERILHAGLAYTDAVDSDTSLVICNASQPDHGKGYQAHELGVPTVSDQQFIDGVGTVADGTGIDAFEQSVDQGQQFALF
jgi:DNA polymerase-3 subunit epsilon